MAPFLDLSGFLALWDGPPLTPQQRAQATLLVGVASQWIYDNGPQGAVLPVDDPTAQFVVYDVVSTAVRYGKYSKLSNFNRTTGHRMDGGAFANPMTALEFTDNHKSMLKIPARSEPMASFRDDDFGTHGLGPSDGGFRERFFGDGFVDRGGFHCGGGHSDGGPGGSSSGVCSEGAPAPTTVTVAEAEAVGDG